MTQDQYQSDLFSQSQYLDEEAADCGYQSLDELLIHNPDLFDCIAEAFRDEHPWE